MTDPILQLRTKRLKLLADAQQCKSWGWSHNEWETHAKVLSDLPEREIEAVGHLTFGKVTVKGNR